MSAVVCLNPSGVSRSTSCNVYRVLCRTMYAFTEAHASSIGLSSHGPQEGVALYVHVRVMLCLSGRLVLVCVV